jgi:hypothetical protein
VSYVTSQKSAISRSIEGWCAISPKNRLPVAMIPRFNGPAGRKPESRGEHGMSNLLTKYRKHRTAARQARELQRAIDNSPSPSVRDELLIAAQRAARI